ncbi:MAG: hypothetical protein G01um101493_198 [Microgenomates group bacterium Gr01-1014_93]|nr:MAG: hypothetical protein G01um101493_198 [Microgenomates group bacterium Gr01-1014_93]
MFQEVVRNENVTHIHKPEGVYTIIYGRHDRYQNPNQFPEEFDGFVMEGIFDTHKGKIPPYITLDDWVRVLGSQCVSVVEYAQRGKLPIYHADFSMKGIFWWPESLFLGGFFSSPLRETIIAHKQEWLMRSLGNTPHLVTIIGEAHTGLEAHIQQSANERMRFLNRLRLPINIVMKDEGVVYKLARCDFDRGKWKVGEILEIPDLKELVI